MKEPNKKKSHGRKKTQKMTKNMKKGYLFGVIPVIKDTHHDETYIEKINYVITRNNKPQCTKQELYQIAKSLNVNPWRLTLLTEEKQW